MGVRFKGWGIAVPDRVVTNDDLSKTLDTSDEWITERTGIRERRIGGSAMSLGVLAGQRAIDDAGMTLARHRLPGPRHDHPGPARPGDRPDDRRRPWASPARRWTSTPRAAGSCSPCAPPRACSRPATSGSW